jgi:hypothetical protein
MMVDIRKASPSDQGDAGIGDDRRTPRPLHILLLATVPPALIVAVDEWAIFHGNRNHWDESALAILYTLYVVQVAALTSFVGRFVNTWFLRSTILIWVLALIDLRLFTMTLGNSSQCLTYAFLSGQLSLLVFVTTLGPGPWPWRLPSAMAAAVFILYFVFGNRAWHEAWSTVLILQTLVTFPLFLLLLLTGYRIRPQDRASAGRQDDTAQHGFSFSIKHMLFWMLAAVPILSVGQHLSPVGHELFDMSTWLRLLYVATCLSIVPLLVVVTVFSNKHALWLVPLSTIIATAMGGLLWATVAIQWVPAPMMRRSWQDWLLADLTEIGIWWIPWTLLSAAFLAGLLLLFRAAGYRLEHRRQPRSPFGESTA